MKAKAAPPKPSLPLVTGTANLSNVFGRPAEPHDTWNVMMGALGYWLPHAINRSASYRAAIRGLR